MEIKEKQNKNDLIDCSIVLKALHDDIQSELPADVDEKFIYQMLGGILKCYDTKLKHYITEEEMRCITKNYFDYKFRLVDHQVLLAFRYRFFIGRDLNKIEYSDGQEFTYLAYFKSLVEEIIELNPNLITRGYLGVDLKINTIKAAYQTLLSNKNKKQKRHTIIFEFEADLSQQKHFKKIMKFKKQFVEDFSKKILVRELEQDVCFDESLKQLKFKYSIDSILSKRDEIKQYCLKNKDKTYAQIAEIYDTSTQYVKNIMSKNKK